MISQIEDYGRTLGLLTWSIQPKEALRKEVPGRKNLRPEEPLPGLRVGS